MPKYDEDLYYDDDFYTCVSLSSLNSTLSPISQLDGMYDDDENDPCIDISLNNKQTSPSFSPICQLDGIITLDFGNDLVPNEKQSVITRVANFELNQAKQVAGIYRDAKALDYTVTYKDSNKNVNILCSGCKACAMFLNPGLSSTYSWVQNRL